LLDEQITKHLEVHCGSEFVEWGDPLRHLLSVIELPEKVLLCVARLSESHGLGLPKTGRRDKGLPDVPKSEQ
jgi:hypothetical protein